MRGMSVASRPMPIMVNTPQPSEAFAWVQAAEGPALVCRPLLAIARHLFTSRVWPLGQSRGSEQAAWEAVAREVRVAPGQLARLHQVHGTTVVLAADALTRHPAADIIITVGPDVAIAVQTADCVPILLADRQTGAVGAAHAGWRGLAASVPSVVVSAMVTEFGSRPGDLVAAVGPAIGACCYEVGIDVREAFQTAFERKCDRWFFEHPVGTPANRPMPRVLESHRKDRWFLDTAAAAREQLKAAGLLDHQIFTSGLCTASHPIFCSFRRDGSPAGRMAAAIRPGRDRGQTPISIEIGV